MSTTVSISSILAGEAVLVSAKFEEKTRRTDGCWEWQGACDVYGYGRYYHLNTDGKAHRVAYQFACGPIPSDHVVCHRCDNPKCVRPDHLFLGLQADNARDMYAKGRQNLSGLAAADHSGDNHGQAKLTARDVEEMLALLKAGMTPKEASRRYNISLSRVYSIRSGRAWKCVSRKD